MSSIGFIGAGNIASAIIAGILSTGTCRADDIAVCEVDPEKNERFAAQGMRIAADECDLVTNSKYVFLTVKPNDLVSVLRKIGPSVTSDNVLISVVAGISIDFIKRAVGHECKVVRVMPNTPILHGCGATALAYEMPITYRELNYVKDIFESAGIVEILPEDRMNEIISVSGSSPAYVFMLADAMIKSAVAQGIDEEIARHMVAQTIVGSAKILANTEEPIETLISRVASPNGTTIKAIEHFEKRGLEQIVGDAMLQCTKRAAMLEKELEEQM